MSTTVTYKGSTLTTVNNNTKTLKTAGKYMEGDVILTDVSGGTGAISVVDTIDSHGGTIREITALDISDTTAVASDVLNSKWFYTSDGTKTQGTATGGGSPSATQHTIYFEFTDSTDTTINAWYDSSFISDAIRATTPTTYGQKTVSLAQLDGVTWYEPTPIPVGVELIDFTKTTNDYVVNSSGNVVAEQWYSVSDYTEIDPSMTFSYSGCYWFYIGFYDASKNTISALNMSSDGTQRPNDTNYCDGTLTPAKIPSNAKYVRITSTYNPDSTILSLIRTA